MNGRVASIQSEIISVIFFAFMDFVSPVIGRRGDSIFSIAFASCKDRCLYNSPNHENKIYLAIYKFKFLFFLGVLVE